jgi:replication-associated recombination protein RarA
MIPIYERYRPRSFAEVIGQDATIRKLTDLENRCGFIGRAFWISGRSSTGKTTIARIIASKVACNWATYEIDGADLRMDDIRQYETKFAPGRPIGGGGWALIINEAQNMGRQVLARLNTFLEDQDVMRHTVVIFTCLKAKQEKLFDDDPESVPFLSRCKQFNLSDQGLCEVFARRAQEIATAENLNGQPIEAYMKLAKETKNNLRDMLQRIEDGDMVAAE